SSITFNLSNPAAGAWFVAAHLPVDDGRIEQKGFLSCSYFFQPQLTIRRAVDTPILQHGQILQQTAAPDKPARLKLYVPEFASSLSVSVADCSSGDEADGGNCPLVLRVGSVSLQRGPVTVNCSGSTCTAALPNPPWDDWLRVDVEGGRDNRSVSFTVVSNYTDERGPGCGRRPQQVPWQHPPRQLELRDQRLAGYRRRSLPQSVDIAVNAAAGAGVCVERPRVREELDVLSLRFTPVNGPNVSVTHTHPTLFSYPLHTQATGGTLNLQLTLNTVSTTRAEIRWCSSVVACLSPGAPVLQLDQSRPCRTGNSCVLEDMSRDSGLLNSCNLCLFVCACSFFCRLWPPGECQHSQSCSQTAFPSVNNLVPHTAAPLQQQRLREHVAGVRGAGGVHQRLRGGLWHLWRMQTPALLQLPVRCLCLQGW
ncbi:unnamed protein product, partial [Tetraodon nigroviridis]